MKRSGSFPYKNVLEDEEGRSEDWKILKMKDCNLICIERFLNGYSKIVKAAIYSFTKYYNFYQECRKYEAEEVVRNRQTMVNSWETLVVSD